MIGQGEVSSVQRVSDFEIEFDEVQHAVHENAKAHGWWDGLDHSDGEKIALMHSELSEALEAMRKGNPPSEKIPDFSHVEEELADVVIRIMDYAEAKNLDVSGAIVAKNGYNIHREHRHGGKLF